MENNKSNVGPGRPRKIDREKLLDVAEAIISREGASGLTIDAVAKALGVTKGGVQYAFGTKEALIHALFERWNAKYEALINAMTGEGADALDYLRAHASVTFGQDETDNGKAAAMLAALIQSPEHLEPTRQWYRERFEMMKQSTPQVRTAFLAIEGAFLLRYFGLANWTKEEWEDLSRDIRRQLEPGHDK